MDRVLTRDDGSRTSLRTVVGDRLVDPRVVSGLDPSYSILVWCCLAQKDYLRRWWRRGDSNS